MDLDVVFLGTAGSVPTPQRGLTSMLVRRGGHRLLFDCGEGTQRQMMRSCGLSEVDAIFLTHLHADHFLGLPGMLKTFMLRERSLPLIIAGPRGLLALYRLLRPVIGKLDYDVDVHEANDGWMLSMDGYVVEAAATDHTVPSVGYRLREHGRPGRFDVATAKRLGVPDGPLFGQLQRGEAVTLDDGTTVEPASVVGEARHGRSLVFTGDTRACAAVRDLARNVTLLVHDATFCSDEQTRARQTGHSTARDAALTAVAADVQMLALVHLSNRYVASEVLNEALEIFPGAICPRDFDVVEMPFPERGVPRHVPSGARPRRRMPSEGVL